MSQDQQRRWRPTGGQVLWTVCIVVALVVLLRIGYALQWTGFGQSKIAQDVRAAKTLWDWLQLLIVPAVLGAGGYYLASYFTRAQNRATLVAAERQAQDEALQAYLGQMSDMLIPNDDQPSLSDARPPDSLKTVARARTLTLLPRLDADRKARVVQFVYESGLVTKASAVLDLNGADLRGAKLHKASLVRTNLSSANLDEVKLSDANLSGADLINTNLSGADLRNANLSDADLSNSDLSGADVREAYAHKTSLMRTNLREAYLNGANLEQARLRGANLRKANFREADLRSANLRSANLSGADLSDANLSGADLSSATGIPSEELQRQASSLEGATMPNGQTYEDWIADIEP